MPPNQKLLKKIGTKVSILSILHLENWRLLIEVTLKDLLSLTDSKKIFSFACDSQTQP